MTEELFTTALLHDGRRDELAGVFTEDLRNTLSPVIEQLHKVAKLLMPYQTFSDWNEALQSPLRELIDTALDVKCSTAKATEEKLEFIWSGHGDTFIHTDMETRGPMHGGSAAVVLTTLVPGLKVEFQENGKSQNQVLFLAQVLEKLQTPKGPETACKP